MTGRIRGVGLVNLSASLEPTMTLDLRCSSCGGADFALVATEQDHCAVRSGHCGCVVSPGQSKSRTESRAALRLVHEANKPADELTVCLEKATQVGSSI